MLIQLLENTGYRYDEKYRFYGWEKAAAVKPVKECGASDLAEFYLHCAAAWSAETCSPRFRPSWTPENPGAGQCTITAALVHEYFGGEVLCLPLVDTGKHSFNCFDGVIIDLASEQFGKDAVLEYPNSQLIEADCLLVDDEKQKRYELLKERLGLS